MNSPRFMGRLLRDFAFASSTKDGPNQYDIFLLVILDNNNRPVETPKIGDRFTSDSFSRKDGPWDRLKPGESLWTQVVYERHGREYRAASYAGSNDTKRFDYFVEAVKTPDKRKTAFLCLGSDKNVREVGWREVREIPWDGFGKELRAVCAGSFGTTDQSDTVILLKIVEDPTL